MVNQFTTLASLVESAERLASPLRITGLCPPARSLVAVFLARQADARNVLCVLPDWHQAVRFAEEVRFFSSLFRHKDPAEKWRRKILCFPPALSGPPGLRQAAGDFVDERIRTLLYLLNPGAPFLVVTSQEAFREKVPPPGVFQRNIRTLQRGDEADRDELAAFLQGTGYRRVPVVEAPGEFAVRGSLIDLYPLTLEQPVRLDFFGDSVDGIRVFHPETQRSLDTAESVTVSPAGLFIGQAVNTDGVWQRVKERADFLGLPARKRLEFLERIETGPPLHEVPILLPFLYPSLDTLGDYLQGGVLTILLEPEKIRGDARAHRELWEISVQEETDRGRIIPAPEDLYADLSCLEEPGGNRCPVISFSDLPALQEEESAGPGSPETGESLRMQARTIASELTAEPETGAPRGFSRYLERIDRWSGQGYRVFLVCASEPEKARLARLLNEYDRTFLQPSERIPFREGSAGLYLLRGALSQGFHLPDQGMIFLHEEDIFGKKVRKQRLAEVPLPERINLKDLVPGDHVVHIDFGIGRYLGLKTLNIRGLVNDYLHLQYEGDDKLYLPVDRASRIQKYISTEDQPPGLDKLGGTAWVRTKQKVKESVLAMAEELVSLYAVRTVRKGYSFSLADADYQEFEATFPFEETPDQVRAIDDVIRDMENERPMDRLVCGDVGYGKTEVAVRAAYKSVTDGKQVALLVPTTVLAQQHYVNFRKRFQEQPVEVQMLSRFRSAREQRTILEAVKEGRVDIVIGTHRLLQKDVRFRDLGLLILDEEQRFGVRHKESLKKIRTEVDVLTLTATPIPRTLQMSLLGLRDLSTIRTPPQDRHAIETFIVPFDDEIVRRALTFELDRGGQAFFVHNRVSDIEIIAGKLKEIVPQARIAVGHGQMAEKALERVMLEFVQGAYDILVCTTIIESGLDIPNVNTLLVHRAERFGLAQLYQLRGRVGRSERQAYAYFIVHDEETLSDDARKRLEALYQFTELGSGFRIARYDLEIRGAGNLLGTSQSGQVKAVGYDLYMEFLETAIRKLKGEEVVEEVDPEIHLDMPAYLPREYIDDSTQRLSFYKRLASAPDHEEVERVRGEMLDRYGPLPPPARLLFELIHVKVRLRRMRIREARLAEGGLMLTFAEDTPVPVSRIMQWVQQEPERTRLFPDNRLLVRFSSPAAEERIRNIEKVLTWLET